MGMTREVSEKIVRGIKDRIENVVDIDDWAEFWGFTTEEYEEFLDMAIETLEAEPLTDTEQRIFLAAMGREQKVRKEACKDGDGVDLVAVCRSIERKVKKALWG